MKSALSASRHVAAALEQALGDDLVAVYLHGSAVLGDFIWARSDLDILALSRGALSDAEFDAIVRGLSRLAYPADGLEFTLMTAVEAAQPDLPAPRFQLHQTTDGRDQNAKVVDGRDRAGDPDLVLHMAVCRDHGQPIFGPPPRSLLATMPDEAIEAAVRDEIGWARHHASTEYLVLTAARVWLFTETHRIASKIEAGEWAAARYDEPRVIQSAIARQRGSTTSISITEAQRFVEHVERLVDRP